MSRELVDLLEKHTESWAGASEGLRPPHLRPSPTGRPRSGPGEIEAAIQRTKEVSFLAGLKQQRPGAVPGPLSYGSASWCKQCLAPGHRERDHVQMPFETNEVYAARMAVYAEKAADLAAKRKIGTCKVCGCPGHRAGIHKRREYESDEEHAARMVDLSQGIVVHAHDTHAKVSARPKKPRACSTCRSPGHQANRCPKVAIDTVLVFVEVEEAPTAFVAPEPVIGHAASVEVDTVPIEPEPIVLPDQTVTAESF